jgi:hypothetical protein
MKEAEERKESHRGRAIRRNGEGRREEGRMGRNS